MYWRPRQALSESALEILFYDPAGAFDVKLSELLTYAELTMTLLSYEKTLQSDFWRSVGTS